MIRSHRVRKRIVMVLNGREYSRINLCRILSHMTEPSAQSQASASDTAQRTVTPSHASNWFVYLIRTHSGMLYTGISTDPHRRLRQHQGEIVGGAKALRGKGPLQLVWQYRAPNRRIASQWEFQLKQLPKKAKEQLVSLLWQPDFLLLQQEDSDDCTANTSHSPEVA